VSKKCPSRLAPAWDPSLIYDGAGSRIRTDDLLITNQLLYQLSYAGILPRQTTSWGRFPKIEQVYTTIFAALLKQI
jgi:hypothetical protein